MFQQYTICFLPSLGMVLSVVVVLLLTVLYEFLKVWKSILVQRSESPSPPCLSPEQEPPENTSSLANSPSQISLAPTENTTTPVLGTSTVNRYAKWLWRLWLRRMFGFFFASC